jgi:hypothetical protein
MNRRRPVPEEFDGIPFARSRATNAGVTAGRLRSHDLHIPFHGVRVAASVERTFDNDCRAYQSVMKIGAVFSHQTAARDDFSRTGGSSRRADCGTLRVRGADARTSPQCASRRGAARRGGVRRTAWGLPGRPCPGGKPPGAVRRWPSRGVRGRGPFPRRRDTSRP